VLSVSALKFSDPVIFRVGMVADNLSFHVNKIARAQPKVFRGQALKTQPAIGPQPIKLASTDARARQ
jgi:hypothetical protein